MQGTLETKIQTTPEKKSRFRWIVLSIIFLTYLIAGADRANIGVVVPFFKAEFKLTNTDIGAMTSLFWIGFSCTQIPAGLYFGKFGVRKMLTFVVVLTSAATFLVGISSSAFHLKLSRLLLGIAEGPISIGILTTINRWFPASEKALAIGIYNSSVKLSSAMVPPVCATIILLYGWREVFYIFAIPGFLAAALLFWLVKDKPQDSPYCSKAELEYIQAQKPVANSAQDKKSIQPQKSFAWLDRIIRAKKVTPLTTNRDIFCSWNVWGCALGYMFLAGITYGIMTWIPTYLITVKKFSIMKMGFVAAAPWVGAVLGNIIGGWLSDKVFDKRRKPVMLITTSSTVFMMYTLIYAPNNPLLLGLILLVAGIMLSLGFSTSFAYAMGLTSKEKYPIAASIINTCGSLGAALTPFVIGVILDTFNWDIAFMFLAASSLLTFLLLFTIIEPIEEYKASITQ